MFTYNPDISVLDERRVCGDLALVQSFVAPLCELDLQLPVVRLLVDDLQQDDDDDDDDGTHNSSTMYSFPKKGCHCNSRGDPIYFKPADSNNYLESSITAVCLPAIGQ